MQRITRVKLAEQSAPSLAILKNYPQLKILLLKHLPPSTTTLFATPEIDGEYINWYSPLEGQAELIDSAKANYQQLLDLVHSKQQNIQLLATSLYTAGDLSADEKNNLIKLSQINPATSKVYLVNKQPIIADWSEPVAKEETIPPVAKKKFKTTWWLILLIPLLMALYFCYLWLTKIPPSVVLDKNSIIYSRYNDVDNNSILISGSHFAKNKPLQFKLLDANNKVLYTASLTTNEQGNFAQPIQTIIGQNLLQPYQNYSIVFISADANPDQPLRVEFSTPDVANITASAKAIDYKSYTQATQGIDFSGQHFVPNSKIDLRLQLPDGQQQNLSLQVDETGQFKHKIYNQQNLALAQAIGQYQANFTTDSGFAQQLAYLVNNQPSISLSTKTLSDEEYSHPELGVDFSGEQFSPLNKVLLRLTNPQGQIQQIPLTVDANGKFNHKQFATEKIPVDKLSGKYLANFSQDDFSQDFTYTVIAKPYISFERSRLHWQNFTCQHKQIIHFHNFKPNQALHWNIYPKGAIANFTIISSSKVVTDKAGYAKASSCIVNVRTGVPVISPENAITWQIVAVQDKTKVTNTFRVYK